MFKIINFYGFRRGDRDLLTELYSTKEFIIANNLKEVTEPILFEKGNIPTANE